jgi:Uma2 family endonuclease
MIPKPRATAEDLARVPENGKAELVGGELRLMSPTGGMPGRASGKIYASLLRHEEEQGEGYALPDNVGFLVDLPDRQSFSPDAAWYTGPTIDMSFVEGPPAFVVEVRSEGDYGPAAEREIEAKIADCFAAGTKVVWDADLLSADRVRKFNFDHPHEPTIFREGEIADAAPAVPGWRFEVKKLLR